MDELNFGSFQCISLPQGLFYRVIGGEVTPFRLVRLSPEELLSKEISEWRKSEAAEVNIYYIIQSKIQHMTEFLTGRCL